MYHLQVSILFAQLLHCFFPNFRVPTINIKFARTLQSYALYKYNKFFAFLTKIMDKIKYNFCSNLNLRYFSVHVQSFSE